MYSNGHIYNMTYQQYKVSGTYVILLRCYMCYITALLWFIIGYQFHLALLIPITTYVLRLCDGRILALLSPFREGAVVYFYYDFFSNCRRFEFFWWLLALLSISITNYGVSSLILTCFFSMCLSILMDKYACFKFFEDVL